MKVRKCRMRKMINKIHWDNIILFGHMMLQFLSKYCEAGVKTKPTQQISKVFILNPYISKNNILMVHIQSL